MNARDRTLILLVPLAVIDAIIPVPILGLVLAYVLLTRPGWFWRLVREVYERP